MLLTVATAGCSFTLVIPALPAIAAATEAGFVTATWILTGYLLASSVTTPILGRLGDILGRRTILGWTLSLMLLGMLVGSFANDIGTLIAARVLVGCGGGAVPLTMGIAYDEVAPCLLSKTIGQLAAVSGLGSLVGLMLSAALMDAFGYRSLFWFPILLVVGAGGFAVRDARREEVGRRERPRARVRVGWVEHLLLAVWLTLPLVLLSAMPIGLPVPWAAALVALTALAHAGWRALHRRSGASHPRERASTALHLGNVIGVAMAAALFGSYALLPLFAVHGFPGSEGGGVAEATYVLLPFEIGFLTSSAVGGTLSAAAPRTVIVVGGVVAALSFAALAVRSIGALALATTGVLGGALGFAYPVLALLILEAAPTSRVGSALAFNTNLRTVGGALGTQAVAMLTDTASSLAGKGWSGVSLSCALLAVLVGGAGALGLMLPRDQSARPGFGPAPRSEP